MGVIIVLKILLDQDNVRLFLHVKISFTATIVAWRPERPIALVAI